MINHLYFHFGQLDYLKILNEDDQFEEVSNYKEIIDYNRTVQYEFGRIKTKNNYLHFLCGRIKQEGCPWCDGPCELIEFDSKIYSSFICLCIECKNCGSCGPMLNINRDTYKEAKDHIVDLVWCRYIHRRTWDDGFINPYEKNADN